MYLLSRLFLYFAETAEARRQQREEAYLADSVDIYDLEFRMRKLDREKSTRHPSWMNHYG